MFGFRKVRMPLTTFQRVDIELLMRRTIDVIGLPFVRQAHVLTSLDELELDQTNSQTLVETAHAEVVSRLPEQQAECEVVIVADSELGYPSTYSAATDDRPAVIRLAKETVADPLRTVMELAFQLSCHHWHGVPASTDLDRSARTSDLMPICCGFGVLGSEACLYDDQWSQAGWSGWSISRSGYYSTVEIGYALALFARCRNDVAPAWLSTLRLDSRETAQLSWEFFEWQEKAGHCLLFDAETIPSTKADMSQLATWLMGADPAYALASGYALAKLDGLSPRAVEAAINASRVGDPDLVPLAVRVLGKARTLTPELEKRVLDLCKKSKPRITVAAMQAAVELKLPLDGYRRKLAKLIDYFAGDPSPILELIGSQGEKLSGLAPRIMPRLALALRDDDKELVDACLVCLLRVRADTDHLIPKFVKAEDLLEVVRARIVELERSSTL
jgi:hypothetical protein